MCEPRSAKPLLMLMLMLTYCHFGFLKRYRNWSV